MEVSNKKNALLIIVCIFSIIISFFLGMGSLLLFFRLNPDFIKGDVVTNEIVGEKEVIVEDKGIADAVSKVYNSVVIVETYRDDKIYATGSGFVYKKVDNTYYMITNQHVIQNGDTIKVLFTSGQHEVVNVVGGDVYADIAVLSLETKNDIKIASLGNNNDSRIGDTVFSIGTPIDSTVYSWTVTRGILSGKDREVVVKKSGNLSTDLIMQVLQTDAAINSGNSGGALCNSNGEVIGVTNMKLVTSGVEGMGFAIPIEAAKSIADTLVEGGDITRPVLGIKMDEVGTKYAAEQYGLTEPISGVIILEISENGSFYNSGLRVNDVLIKLNDKEISNVASLRYELYKYKVGDEVVFTYVRDGNQMNVKVKLKG